MLKNKMHISKTVAWLNKPRDILNEKNLAVNKKKIFFFWCYLFAGPNKALVNTLCVYSPWNHKKTYGFLIVSGGLEVNSLKSV